MSSGTRSKSKSASATRKNEVPFTNSSKIKIIEPRNSKVSHNLFSHLAGPDKAGLGILSFLDKKNIETLKSTSFGLRKAVLDAEEFGHKNKIIKGPLKIWREEHPKAKYANISGRNDLENSDFQYLQGIEEIYMSNCDNNKYDRRAFKHLSAAKTLDISHFENTDENKNNFNPRHFLVNLKNLRTLIARDCKQLSNFTFEESAINKTPVFKHLKVLNIRECKQISNYPFKYFENLEELNISYCNVYITGDAFKHLKNLKILNMAYCNQDDINDEAFTHLENLHTLIMRGCKQNTISDNAFKNLSRLTTLDISYCTQLTSEAFKYFKNIKNLSMEVCTQNTIRSDAFLNLKNIEELNMAFCTSELADRTNTGITDNIFEFFRNPEKLKKLDISYCNQFTDYTFERFDKFINLRDLNMEGCIQETITNKAFKHFDKITTLNMKYCDQNTIGDDAFTNLANIEMLNMNNCKQTTITSEAFKHLKSLQILYMIGCKQYTIGDEAFKYLGTINKIKTLNITQCNQHAISDEAFTHLSSLTELRMCYCKQNTITGRTLTIDNLPKLRILDIYKTNNNIKGYAKSHFGVTETNENVNFQFVRTRYARTAKRKINYTTLTRRN